MRILFSLFLLCVSPIAWGLRAIVLKFYWHLFAEKTFDLISIPYAVFLAAVALHYYLRSEPDSADYEEAFKFEAYGALTEAAVEGLLKQMVFSALWVGFAYLCFRFV